MVEPLISVLMVNYNHESTLAESIRSVLQQTWRNIQLIVVDDGSTDGSVDVVEAFLDDPRIELHRLSANRHICAATNYGFERVSGEWLARIDSDDIWYPNRLERQMEFLSEHPEVDVCFSWCDFIDEKGNDVSELVGNLPEAQRLTCSTRREWLRHFYYHCNFLIHSSVLMRTSAMRDTGGFELTYRQLHDFDYWVRLSKRHEMRIVPERLVAMRKFIGEEASNENASLSNLRNITRTFNEYLDIRAHFFDDVSDDLLTEAFGEDFACADSSTPEELLCERAFLLCRPQDNWDVNVTPAGLRALKQLYANDTTRRLLETKYGMPIQRFYELATEHVYNDLVITSNVRTNRELISSLRAEEKALGKTVNILNKEIGSLRAHTQALELLVDEKNSEIDRLREEVDELRSEVRSLRESASWRITAPLRSLSNFARNRTTKSQPTITSLSATANPTVLLQAHLSGNLGDDLFVRTICSRYPNVSFLLATDGDYEGRFADIPNLKLHPVEEFGSLVTNSDAVAHISGSCFIRDYENFSAFFAADKFLADNARHVYFLGGNFGPYEGEAILEAYRLLFRRYDGLTFRDRYSAGLFPGYPNVAYAPDILFGYPAVIREKRRRALVCPISLEGREGTFAISEYKNPYRTFSAGVIRALMARNYEVTLVSFNQSQGDEREIEGILEALGEAVRSQVRAVFYRTSPNEVIPEFEDAECVIATRFHSMVLGIAHGCKVLPIVYNQKTEKVLEDLSYPLGVKLDELSEADPESEVDALVGSTPIDVAPLAAASVGHFQFLDQIL